MPHARRARIGRMAGVVLITAAALLTAGCRPEPAPSATEEPSATATATATATPSATPSPTPSGTPAPAFGLPADCESLYSPAMLASLEAENPPLNDPGVTMLSTQDVDLLEIIDGADTIRCSWGAPGELGLATNVTVIDADQAEFIADELAVSGFDCAAHAGGTLCRAEQKGVTQDDVEYASGETHFVGAGAWVSTAWINFSPDGYTEDIVATLWP